MIIEDYFADILHQNYGIEKHYFQISLECVQISLCAYMSKCVMGARPGHKDLTFPMHSKHSDIMGLLMGLGEKFKKIIFKPPVLKRCTLEKMLC